jgi:hypothetical protein
MSDSCHRCSATNAGRVPAPRSASQTVLRQAAWAALQPTQPHGWYVAWCSQSESCPTQAGSQPAHLARNASYYASGCLDGRAKGCIAQEDLIVQVLGGGSRGAGEDQCM